MPARIRHSPLVAGLSTADSPLLPFLAPRLLQPWPAPTRSRRAKTTRAECPVKGSGVVDDANGSSRSLQDWQSRPRATGEQRCLKERARATASMLLSRRRGNVHIFDGTRRTYSTGATEALENDMATVSFAPPGLPNRVRQVESHGRDDREKRTLDSSRAAFKQPREYGEDDFNEDEALERLRDKVAWRYSRAQARSGKQNNLQDGQVLEKSPEEEEEFHIPQKRTQPSQKRLRKYGKFPLLSRAWNFMLQALEARPGLVTVPFDAYWRVWFGGYYRKLVHHKAENPVQYAKMEERASNLLSFESSLSISELRKMWLEFTQHIPYMPASVLIKHRGEEEIMWSKMAKDRWPELMLNILAERPKDGLKFLLATCVSPLVQRLYYSDVIDYLIRYYLETLLVKKDFDHLFDSIMTLLYKYTNFEVAISDFAVSHLFKRASIAQADAFYRVLIAREKQIGINTSLRVASMLGHRGATDTALKILQVLHNSGVDFTLSSVESVCATVLRGSQRDPNQKIREGEVFERFLDLGLRPRINFYNTLLHNAVESGDPVTAWRVYDMLLENSIEPSPHTYSILINDAKWRYDHEAFDRIIETLKKKDIRNEFVANDTIHAMWLLSEERMAAFKDTYAARKARKAAFYQIMLIYVRHFKMEPLLDLAPDVFKVLNQNRTRPGPEEFQENISKKIHPDSATLNLIITIGLKYQFGPEMAGDLYRRYKELLEQGHPDYVRLAKAGTWLSNAFIKKLGEHPATLPQCMTVMTDMLMAQETQESDQVEALSHVYKEARDDWALTGNKLPFVKPTVITWTVLLQAFMKQNQLRAAQKVMSMMKARGVKPDQVTWDQLVTGYANANDESGVVDAMARARNAGCFVNEQVLERMSAARSQAGIMQQVVWRAASLAKETEGDKSDPSKDIHD